MWLAIYLIVAFVMLTVLFTRDADMTDSTMIVLVILWPIVLLIAALLLLAYRVLVFMRCIHENFFERTP